MARAPDFDLASALARPNFTPARADAAALVELLVTGAEPATTRAAPALAGLGADGRAAIAARFSSADDGAKARLLAVIGLLARAGDGVARGELIARMGDPASRVRRAAAVALGKLAAIDVDRAPDDEVRAVLVARWDAGDLAPDERRTLAEALGKVGGEHALARLQALDPGADDELARRRDRAILMADRTARRGEASEIATDVPPPRPLTVRLGGRPGLGGLLGAELTASGLGPAQARGHADVEIQLDRAWSALHASRMWATAAIRVPFVGGTGAWPTEDRGRAAELGRAIVRTLTSPDVLALLRTWTRGPVRWRLAMEEGHQRSVVWRVAKQVTAIAPDLINDPTATTWDVTAFGDARVLELVPRRAYDPRFAYRVADVPAASHPTVAAAIAWLVERARRGAYRSLLGTDLDEIALAATRANLDAAGVTAQLAVADARSHTPGPVDLILTNPPLGSRVRVDAIALLCAALPGLARQLAPGGRLVWITPATRKTAPVATQHGLQLVRSIPVDLGGVRGHLERWDLRP